VNELKNYQIEGKTRDKKLIENGGPSGAVMLPSKREPIAISLQFSNKTLFLFNVYNSL